jgi:hypothetical protein
LAAQHFSTLSSFLGQRCAIVGLHELPFDPLVRTSVAPYVRDDLKGVFLNLRSTKGSYYREIESPSVTRFIDQESGYAS